MTTLIGVCGLCGVGKTTAVGFLTEICPAQSVYLGKYVLEEVKRRGLEPTAQNERSVQLECRERDGPIALAALGLPSIKALLFAGHSVVIDAIFTPEEYEHLSNHAGADRSMLISITAPFALRCERLAIRSERPLTPDEIRKRDANEKTALNIGTVANAADHAIENSTTFDVFKAALTNAWAAP